MAKDKRRTMGTDLNEVDLKDMDTLTDQEREALGQAKTDPVTKSGRRKKAM